MKMLLLFFLCLAAPLLGEEPNPWLNKLIPQLVLSTGKTYDGVKITKIEDDAITITHAGGVARVPVETLKPEAQTALGVDLEKAATARAAGIMAAKEAQAAALARTVSDVETTQMETIPLNHYTNEEKKRGHFLIFQVLKEDGGYLVYTYTQGASAGSAARAMSSITGRSGGEWVPPQTGDKVFFLRGSTGFATANEDIIETIYAATDEVFEFDSLVGIQTVKVYDLIQAKAQE